MNILIVIRSQIPALRYGGTQRVMWYLGKELVKLGHRVTYLAATHSTCDFATIREWNPQAPIDTQIPEDTDVVHFNDFVPAGFTRKPYVVTFHGNRIHTPIDKNAIFVSRNHAKRFNSHSYVYNGLDWEDYGQYQEFPREHFHFLGKAAWSVKNLKGCIDLIKSMDNEQLYVLGGYRLNFKMGFRWTLTRKAHFLGMVGGSEKLAYLWRSKGLLFPVIWDEPFGLAVTESMYCGAPVFGTTYGSLPELVIDEVGFLTNSKEEMLQHLLHGYHYHPKVCHEYAAELFNSKRMALAYLEKYEQVLSGNRLNTERPYPLQPDNRYDFR